jgi:hypothetical protein
LNLHAVLNGVEGCPGKGRKVAWKLIFRPLCRVASRNAFRAFGQ